MRRKLAVRSVIASFVLATLGVVAAGCLTRPVTRQEPTTKVNFTAAEKEQAVEKGDLLFVVDNSASMGDKQAYLSLAGPNLITPPVQPNCVDLITVTMI